MPNTNLINVNPERTSLCLIDRNAVVIPTLEAEGLIDLTVLQTSSKWFVEGYFT